MEYEMRRIRLALMATLVIFSIGCGTDDDASSDMMFTLDGGMHNAQPDSTAPTIEKPDCVSATLPTAIPATLEQDTSTSNDTFGPAPCVVDGTDGSNDFSVFFVAPAAGQYRFSTLGSSFDTVLHARTPACDGEPIECNDDAEETTSAFTLALDSGEAVILVIDGFNRETGRAVLTVSGVETACDNGMDDDNDGVSDCDDSDCFLSCEDPADWPQPWVEYEREVLEETNRARAEARNCANDRFEPAPPLEMDIYLTYSARLHARDMGINDYFEHTSLDGRSATDRMRQAGFMGASPTGENIAAGQNSPAEVVQAWIDSPGHCRNLMDPEYRVLGVGYSDGHEGQFSKFWVQNFGGSH